MYTVYLHKADAYYSIYTGLRVSVVWANCLSSLNMSVHMRKVEEVTTISKLQTLTSVRIIDCNHRRVFACGRDGSTPFYRVCFSGVANTQALLTYLNFKILDLYYSRMSRCGPPPPPYSSSRYPAAEVSPSSSGFTTPLWFVSQSLFHFSVSIHLHKLFFRTFSPCCQGISCFSQFVSVFSTFKLFVPPNRIDFFIGYF